MKCCILTILLNINEENTVQNIIDVHIFDISHVEEDRYFNAYYANNFHIISNEPNIRDILHVNFSLYFLFFISFLYWVTLLLSNNKGKNIHSTNILNNGLFYTSS